MWRSIVAGRSSLLTSLRSVPNAPPNFIAFISSSTSTSPPHFQPFSGSLRPNPRFFSQPSLDSSGGAQSDDPISEPRFGSESPVPNDDSIDGFDEASGSSGLLDASSFENGDPHVDSASWGDESSDVFSQPSVDLSVFEIDSPHGSPVESSVSDASGGGFDPSQDGLGEAEELDNLGVEADDVGIDEEKLEATLSLLQSRGDGSLETSLEEMGLDLRQEFVLKILETPLVPGEMLLGFVSWASRKPDFSVTGQVLDALVAAISRGRRKKDAYVLWDMIKEVGERENGVLSTDILNKLIALFAKLGKGKAGLEVFNKFGDFGCVPNKGTYFFTIEALCKRFIYDWAWSVCEKMLDEGIFPESWEIGQIISWLCKGKKPKEAHMLYLLAKEKKKYPPKKSVNYLISSLSRVDGFVPLALEMLEDFSGELRKYATGQFLSVIHGLCRINDVVGAKKLLGEMISAGPPPGNAVFNLVINSLSKSGDMKEAMETLKLMESRGLKPDVYTYTVIISGYVSGGMMEEACGVLSEAKRNHSKLISVPYHTLICGFCQLEEFDKALELLDEMKSCGVSPKADEYGKIITSLCLKALDWQTAEKLLKEMKEKGLRVNGITPLIGAVKEMTEEGLDALEPRVGEESELLAS